jgi:hypothetical protein
VNDAAIRQKLADKFRANKLPRSLPNALHPSTLEGHEAVEEIGGGRGQRCCVCDELITVTDKSPIRFRYPTGSYAFHERWLKLWLEERSKPTPRTE